MLIDSSAATPTPRPVDDIGFTREIKSGKLSGSFALSFVRHQQLKPFVGNVVDPIAGLVSDLVSNRLEFLQHTKLAWID